MIFESIVQPAGMIYFRRLLRRSKLHLLNLPVMFVKSSDINSYLRRPGDTNATIVLEPTRNMWRLCFLGPTWIILHRVILPVLSMTTSICALSNLCKIRSPNFVALKISLFIETVCCGMLSVMFAVGMFYHRVIQQWPRIPVLPPH